MTVAATLPATDDVIRNAFADMARWADDLRGWCGPKPIPRSLREAEDLVGWCDHPDPFARMIQAALGIRLALEKIAEEDAFIAKAIREVLIDDDSYEDTGRRCRYQPRRVITADDELAALLVLHQANWALLAEGELAEVKDGLARSTLVKADRQRWHAEPLSIAVQKGSKPGWAAYKYQEKFGEWPPRGSSAPVPRKPSPEVLSWVHSRQIAFAKAKAKEREAAA